MKLKLLTAFVLTISAIALVGYISYEGLQNLMNTLESTSKPDKRLEHFQRLNYMIADAENNVRIYTITKDPSYLRSFYHSSEQLNDHLESLAQITANNKYLSGQLDTINDLVKEKLTIQKQLIHLKRSVQKPDVYDKVVQEIESLENKPPRIDTIEEKVEQKGFFKRLFGAKEKTRITIDTVVNQEKIADEIATSLNEFETQEKQQERALTRAELRLTKKDKAISNQIVQQIADTESYFKSLTRQKAQSASRTFEDTKQMITITGTVSSIIFLIMIFIILNDYQVIQRNKKQLEEAKQRAEYLAQAKEEFLANMSHEIRTPLNAVVGFSEQLSQSRLDDDQKEQLTIIRDASHHLMSLINDILDYAKIEAGKISLERIPVDLNQCAKTVYESLKPKAVEKGIQFKYFVSETFRSTGIIGDPVRINQILYNLVGNAIKFTDKGGVTMRILHEKKKDNHFVRIEIRDTGIGINQGKIKQIFEKFDQADTSTTRKYGGTGLGLAIVKKLVKIHRGRISVQSKINTGTKFTIVFPCKLTEKPGTKRDTPSADPTTLSLTNTRILVADDEDYNLVLLENILHKYNATVHCVKSGISVVETLKEEDFDIILLDLQMPELDGYETVRKIRKSGLRIPVIATTAAVNKEQQEMCQKAGFEEILIKPTPEKTLLETITRHLKLTVIKPDNNATEDQQQNTEVDNIGNNHLHKLIQNDGFINPDMIALYAENLNMTRKILNQALQDRNFEQLQETAHKILPSTRHMELDELAKHLKNLENLAASSTDVKTMQNEIEQFNTLASQTLQTINGFLEKGVER